MNESKLMRKDMNRLGLSLLFSLLLFWISGILPDFAAFLLDNYASAISDSAYFAIIDLCDAVGYALSFLLPALMIAKQFGNSVSDFVGTSMSLVRHPVASVLCAVAILNAAGTVSDGFLDLLARFGLDLAGSYSYSIPTDAPGIIVYFISLVIVPAFFEELLYRGVILGALSKYGRAFAVIVSAVLFGLMHCSFTQFFYAVCAGIVMGYLVSLSGTIWMGIFVHLCVNLTAFVGDYVWVYAGRSVNTIVMTALYCVIYFAGLIGALVLVRDDFGRDIYGEDCPIDAGAAVRASFSPPMLIYAALTLLIAVWNIIPV